MHQFVVRMFALDTNGLALVLILCGLGFLIMRAVLPIAGLAVASLPLLVLGSLASHALLQGTYLVAGLERGPSLALTTGIGMIAALTFVVLFVRIFMLVHDVTGARPQMMRASDEQAP